MKSKVYLKNSSSMEQNSSSNDSLLDTQNTKISSINKLTSMLMTGIHLIIFYIYISYRITVYI
jgi:hypothetical protein